MKLSVPKDFLAAVANQVKLAINEKTIQALSNIKIEAENGVVKLCATDTVLSIAATVHEAQIIEPGSICVPGASFIKLINALSSGVVDLHYKASRLVIQAGNSSFNLSTLSADQFPLLPDPKNTFIEAPLLAVQEMFSSVLYSAGRDTNRPLLTGVFFSPQRIIATDGHRLAMKVNPGFQIKREIVIPAEELFVVLKSFSPPGNIALSYGEREAYFRFGNRLASIRLLEGSYPDVEKVIPGSAYYPATVDHGKLVSALKRVVLLSDQSKAIKMAFSRTSIKLYTASELGEAAETVETEFPLESLNLHVSGYYLLSILEHVKGPMVTFELRDEKTALVIREGDYCHVVMPRRP